MGLLVRHPLLVFVLAIGAGVLGGSCQGETGALPAGLYADLPVVEAFALQSSDGEAFTADDLNDQVWVVNFFFTRCPTICPPMMDEVAGVHERWGDSDDVRFLSITVDGGYDSPEILEAYRDERSLPAQNWVLATGEPAAIVTLSEQSFLQAAAAEMDDRGDITHSSLVLVLDRERRLRGWFDLFDASRAEHERLDEALTYLVETR